MKIVNLNSVDLEYINKIEDLLHIYKITHTQIIHNPNTHTYICGKVIKTDTIHSAQSKNLAKM